MSLKFFINESWKSQRNGAWSWITVLVYFLCFEALNECQKVQLQTPTKQFWFKSRVIFFSLNLKLLVRRRLNLLYFFWLISVADNCIVHTPSRPQHLTYKITLAFLSEIALFNYLLTSQSQTRGWNRTLLLTGIATTIGSANVAGYNIGVINAPSQYIKEWANETVYRNYDVVLSEAGLDLLWSSIVSIFLVGGAIGSLGGSFVADRIGR